MELLRSISHKDPNQIAQYEHDDAIGAKRVVIVGGIIPEFKINVPQASVAPTIQTIEIPTIVKELEIREIEKQVVVKEIQYQEIQVPFIQTEIKVIEVPKYITHTEVKTVEVPVILTQVEYREKDLPLWLKICIAAQILSTISLLLKSLFK